MKKFLPTSENFSASQTKNNPSGFTLIELLVVIAIIAVLAVVGIALFSGTQAKARDAKRQQDVIAMAKALEVNKTAGSTTYPQISSSWFAGSTVPAEAVGYTPQYSIVYTTAAGTAAKPTAWAGTAANPTAPAGTTVATYANGVPASGSIYSFQVCALLEGGTAPNIFCVPNGQ